ncbi:type 1 glutamine amidotransferase domain-containing protein [Gryllotalpicola reticulitermitis]|uniref:Type 1 glutamine amidotransferase domain-containing protein n=1 Tax=Gryllotalpicola reticulitermitis TaxID=1184153 RepID=A0ABV8QCB8_9MICO
MSQLTDKRVAFLMTDGVEQVEYTGPRAALEEAGATVVLVSPKPDSVQGFNHVDKGDAFAVELPVGQADSADFDALVLPGGVVNADDLRTDPTSVAFAKAFFEQHKPVGAICHAAWTLVEAGVVDGRTLTSWPSLQTDLRNAGATWVDHEVVTDKGLVTSRKPDDIPAFASKLIEEIAEGPHGAQHA